MYVLLFLLTVNNDRSVSRPNAVEVVVSSNRSRKPFFRGIAGITLAQPPVDLHVEHLVQPCKQLRQSPAISLQIGPS